MGARVAVAAARNLPVPSSCVHHSPTRVESTRLSCESRAPPGALPRVLCGISPHADATEPGSRHGRQHSCSCFAPSSPWAPPPLHAPVKQAAASRRQETAVHRALHAVQPPDRPHQAAHHRLHSASPNDRTPAPRNPGTISRSHLPISQKPCRVAVFHCGAVRREWMPSICEKVGRWGVGDGGDGGGRALRFSPF